MHTAAEVTQTPVTSHYIHNHLKLQQGVAS